MLVLTRFLSEARLSVIFPALLQSVFEQKRADEDRLQFLKQLAIRVPQSSLPLMLEYIWSIQIIEWQQATLDALLASSHVTPSAWIQVLEIATEKTRTTGKASYLLQVLSAAPPELQSTDRVLLYHAFQEVLHLLARCSRREALSRLAMLKTTIHVLGGDEASVACACAGLEIGSWWP